MAKVKAKIGKIALDPNFYDAAVAFALGKCLQLADEAAPRIVDAAKGRCPVGVDKEFGGRTNVQRVQLRPSVGGGRASEESREYKIFELHARLQEGGRRAQIKEVKKFKGAKVRRKDAGGGFVNLFQGTRKGGTLGQSPTSIKVQGNTIVGAFSSHKPGNLRDSIHYDGATIVDGKVVSSVTASAPYALYVHEGFTHHGGRHHKGSATKIGAKKFLSSALEVNGRAALTGG